MNIKQLYINSYTKKEAALRNMMSPSLKNFIRDIRNAVFENDLITFDHPAVRKAVVANAKQALTRNEQVLERYAKILESKGKARTNPDVLRRNRVIAGNNLARSLSYVAQRDFTDPELTNNLFTLGLRNPKAYKFNDQELKRIMYERGLRKPLAIKDMYEDPNLVTFLSNALDNAVQAQAQPGTYLRNKQLLKQGIIGNMKSGDIF